MVLICGEVAEEVHRHQPHGERHFLQHKYVEASLRAHSTVLQRSSATLTPGTCHQAPRHILSSTLKYGAKFYTPPPPQAFKYPSRGGGRIEGGGYKIPAVRGGSKYTHPFPWKMPFWPAMGGGVHNFSRMKWSDLILDLRPRRPATAQKKKPDPDNRRQISLKLAKYHFRTKFLWFSVFLPLFSPVSSTYYSLRRLQLQPRPITRGIRGGYPTKMTQHRDNHRA